MTTMYMNMTTQDVKDLADRQNETDNNIFNKFKKYLMENSEIIIAGFAAMNGQVYIPVKRR